MDKPKEIIIALISNELSQSELEELAYSILPILKGMECVVKDKVRIEIRE